MQNKVCLITGATSGIGEITAHALAEMGATVVVVSRDPQRCANTVDRIRRETGRPKVDYLVGDLSSQAQVRRVAEEFQRRYPRLDVLVNNAGALFMQRQVSTDGIEMTFALNHLAYFLLTNLLIDRLKTSQAARIVNVSSDAHRGARLNFNDLQGEHGYNGWRAYSQSKLANLLFTFELARRLEGSQITANAMHPGFVATNFGKNNSTLFNLGMRLTHRLALSPEKGAETITYLSASPEVEGVTGKYFVKKKPVRADPAAYDRQAAERLWQVSAAMTGVGQPAL